MVFLKYYFLYSVKFLYILQLTLNKNNQFLSILSTKIYVLKFIIVVFLYPLICIEIYI